MSNTLPVRVKALRARLEALDQLSANVGETASLEDLRSDLAQPVADLKKALDQCALLRTSGVAVKESASLEAARRRATELLEKFTAETKAATLKRGSGWTNLISNIRAASGDVASLVASRWKAYRDEAFTGEAPVIVRVRIAPTPANSAAFNRYEQLYQEFRTNFERLPADRTAVERVQSLAKALTETAKDFDYDVPGDVKRFLEAVQSGGAPLDLLTDTVKTWLTENDAFANYRILPRGNDGRR